MSAICLEFPNKKYQVIYADPAWQYDNTNGFGEGPNGAALHYDVMSCQEICNLPIHSISDKNCVLFLWATVPLMPEAFKVMEAWGFKYKTMLTWRKVNSLGLGFWFRGQTEHLLIGTKGEVKCFHSQKPNVIQSKVQKHSEKPRQFRALVEEVTKGIGPKIELFARERIEGWDSWGNQLPTTMQVCLALDHAQETRRKEE